jgi:tRNA (cmo5U34)-methyltransferase
MSKDEIFATPQSQIVDFVFDEQVVAVFPNMIRRSVPGYETVIPMTGLMAARHLNDGDTAYDLGCSLGATTLAILQQTTSPNVSVIGVDNAPAMIAQARERLSDPRARFECADLTEFTVTDAKVVVLNFVMQFLPPAARLPLLQRLRSQMRSDGLLIVSEKTHQSDADLQKFYDSTHLAWKRANGYSELEVSQKRQSLEQVMIVDSEDIHNQRFSDAGFGHSQTWFRCMNWASFLVEPE